jgi:hypothetical protein
MLALVRCRRVENLDAIECGVVGGIYSPNHQKWPLGGCCRMAHRTVRCATGQSGVPPDTVWCAYHVTEPLESDHWS